MNLITYWGITGEMNIQYVLIYPFLVIDFRSSDTDYFTYCSPGRIDKLMPTEYEICHVLSNHSK